MKKKLIIAARIFVLIAFVAAMTLFHSTQDTEPNVAQAFEQPMYPTVSAIAASGYISSGTSTTFDIEVHGNRRALLVGAGQLVTNVTDVDCNGISLTRENIETQSALNSTIWLLENPPVGTCTITMNFVSTFPPVIYLTAHAVVLNGVDTDNVIHEIAHDYSPSELDGEMHVDITTTGNTKLLIDFMHYYVSNLGCIYEPLQDNQELLKCTQGGTYTSKKPAQFADTHRVSYEMDPDVDIMMDVVAINLAGTILPPQTMNNGPMMY